MKTLNWMMIGLVVGVLAVVGCKKEQPKPTVAEGVAIDIPKLQPAFANAGPDTMTSVSEVRMGVRYGDYPRTLMALGKLSNDPSLNADQKKLVADLTEQVKQAASKAAAAPAQ